MMTDSMTIAIPRGYPDGTVEVVVRGAPGVIALVLSCGMKADEIHQLQKAMDEALAECKTGG